MAERNKETHRRKRHNQGGKKMDEASTEKTDEKPVEKQEPPRELTPLESLFMERAKWANEAENAKIALLTGRVNDLHIYQRKLNSLRDLESAVIDQIVQWRQTVPQQ